MPVWYSPATSKCHEILAHLIDELYPDLVEAEAKVGVVMAHPDPDSDKPAMACKGIRILGKIKANSEADRVDGKPDATITLDAEHWDGLIEDGLDGERKARALLDHELYHLIVRREKESNRVLTDDLGRPKFGMRPHDWEITGFRVVAERHKEHSAEVIVARRFHDDYGNLLFHFGEEFAVQRDLEFAKEVLGMTEDAVAEINADHEKLGMLKPFPNGPIRNDKYGTHQRRQGRYDIVDSGPVDEITEELFAEASA